MEQEPPISGNNAEPKRQRKDKKLPKDLSDVIKMPSKLPKRVLGKDKKLRSKIERQELRERANRKFVSYIESISGQEAG